MISTNTGSTGIISLNTGMLMAIAAPTEIPTQTEM
jgi:hypothetical protein